MTEESPLLEQYRRIKAAHPGAILFFRIGDFYETFEEDARITARELEITLTSKPVRKDVRLPLAGVPWRQMEAYAQRLTRRGHRVAVCDQLEDPKKAKGIVKRGVTRVLSPGTVVEEGAEAGKNLYLALLHRSAEKWGLALADLATGELEVGLFDSEGEATDALLVAGPREILIAEGAAETGEWAERLRPRARNAFFGTIPPWSLEPSWANEVLRKHLGAHLEGFDLAKDSPETIALGALVGHLRETQGSNLPHLTTIRRLGVARGAFSIDEATLRHLEILESSTGEGPTLFSTIDRTKTEMGARALRRALVSPLTDPVEIARRQEAVAALLADAGRAEHLAETLGKIQDIERLLGRVSIRSAGPREILRLALSLSAVAVAREVLAGITNPLIGEILPRLEAVPEVSGEILRALVEEPPLRETEGDLVRPGFSEDLDAIRAGASSARAYLASLQEGERKRTGIGSLRVAYNRVFGYYIEVTKANLARVPSDYERRQTLANAERFTTPELRKAEATVLGAEERAREIEVAIFQDLVTRVLLHATRIRAAAAAAAEIDLLASLSAIASERGYVRPEILPPEERRIEIEGGRHPVLERAVDRFVPNDFTADDAARFFLITGPNMGGKSTYLRQAALLVLLAQAGSFVPAARARISPVDGIYSRVGSSDRIVEGLSTFMVEMVETASILRRATPSSLILLDEIGRGTATYDGLSIAWAVSEFLIGKGAAVLFATHYHEMIDLARIQPSVRNLSVAVREWGREVVFLHEIVAGPADRSYGIEVGRRAGLPDAVVRRAAEILTSLELLSVDTDGRPRVAGALLGEGMAQMDLFGAAGRRAAPGAGDERGGEILARLAEIDPDDLTPREAHAKLAELAEAAREVNS